MTIKPFLIDHMGVFCYLLSCNETNKGVIIDPGGRTEKILSYITSQALDILYIFISHNHPDHTVGNRKIQKTTGAKIVMHEDDALFMAVPGRDDFFARLDFPISDTPPADITVADGEIFTFGNRKITIIHTPGHSPGGICFHCENNLFTGDSLFVGGAGRLDLPGADFQVLIASLEEKIAPLPPETIIWPGHDYGDSPISTIAHEKKNNPFLGGEW